MSRDFLFFFFFKLRVIASSWKYLKLHSREETSKIYTYIYKSLIELTSGEIKVIQTGVALFEAQNYVKWLHSMVELSLSTFNLQNIVLLWLAGFLSCFNYHTNFIGANCSSICSALKKKTSIYWFIYLEDFWIKVHWQVSFCESLQSCTSKKCIHSKCEDDAEIIRGLYTMFPTGTPSCNQF